ncbi:hypothetical protein Hanom_Chr12g01174611 [Helianthus anomalus]
MYSGVHSSTMPQHSHLASTTSDIVVSDLISIASLANSKDMSDTVRLSPSDDSLGGLVNVYELTMVSPCGAMLT